MSRGLLMALAMASLADGAINARHSACREPEDDPEPEDWRERRAWLERMDWGPRYSHPRPLPPVELERWRAAEEKRARKAGKRRGGR